MFYVVAQKAAHHYESADYLSCLAAILEASSLYIWEGEERPLNLLALRFLGDCALMQSRLAQAPFIELAEANPLLPLLEKGKQPSWAEQAAALENFKKQTALLYIAYLFMLQEAEPLDSDALLFRLSLSEEITFFCNSQHKRKEKLTENFQRLFKEKPRAALSLTKIEKMPASLEKMAILEEKLVTKPTKTVILLLAQTFMDLEREEEALDYFLKAQLYGVAKHQVIAACRQLAARLLRKAKTAQERKRWISFLEKIN
ncbi:hypothetical protein SapgrDRAFT_2761 [Saprospira grandis DSM 2844]|uniref:Uncharacterized protein n=1 Tax=Saprospira grandis DSM 2844 TaxID=694433 RepID=J0XZ12_9BACT|nr:hypothetical protein [Saprospira grandis]EJF54416.1 hypothetical protein SapgrDRAFT_2761 [Saprospira grandis DSM 2844]